MTKKIKTKLIDEMEDKLEVGKIFLRKDGPVFEYETKSFENDFGETPNPYDASITSKDLRKYRRKTYTYKYKVLNCEGKGTNWKFTSGNLNECEVKHGLDVIAIINDDTDTAEIQDLIN